MSIPNVSAIIIPFNVQFLKFLDHVHDLVEQGSHNNEDVEKFTAKSLNMFRNYKDICDKLLEIKELRMKNTHTKL